MKLKTFTILLLILLTSCKTLVNNTQQPPNNRTEDTIVITNNNGKISTTLKGMPPKSFTFTEIGQSFTFKNGESIELVLSKIDFSKSAFDIITDLETKDITITLVDREQSKIFITSKCQTIKRLGTLLMLNIEVSNNLKPEQIIITPLFDENCKTIGYEIRYGSEERGCKEAARETLTNFYKCLKGETIKVPCKELKKLSLPCY